MKWRFGSLLVGGGRCQNEFPIFDRDLVSGVIAEANMFLFAIQSVGDVIAEVFL